MAATTIMYEGPRHSIGTIELDAVTTETHGAEVEITDFPIETSVMRADGSRVPLTHRFLRYDFGLARAPAAKAAE